MNIAPTKWKVYIEIEINLYIRLEIIVRFFLKISVSTIPNETCVKFLDWSQELSRLVRQFSSSIVTPLSIEQNQISLIGYVDVKFSKSFNIVGMYLEYEGLIQWFKMNSQSTNLFSKWSKKRVHHFETVNVVTDKLWMLFFENPCKLWVWFWKGLHLCHYGRFSRTAKTSSAYSPLILTNCRLQGLFGRSTAPRT